MISNKMADFHSAFSLYKPIQLIAVDFATSPSTDHIVLISTVTNAIKIYHKVIHLPLMDKKEIENDPFSSSVVMTSFTRCIVGAVPGIGNGLIMGADVLRAFDSVKEFFPKHKGLDFFWKLCTLATRFFQHPILPWIRKEHLSSLKATLKSSQAIPNL